MCKADEGTDGNAPESAQGRRIAVLVSALERLEYSYRLLAAGKPVRDMAETLGEVRNALKEARGA